MTTTYQTRMFDRLDKICDLVYGTANNRVVERVVALMPGIEEYGMLLPAGLVLELPDLPAATRTIQTIEQIKLWD